MLTLRRAGDRGHFDFGWLDTRHTFSFGDYFEEGHHAFRALRVLNEDRVRPGQGFGTHGHRDMEILTWVLEGALEHRDSLGTHGVIRPGEAQIMSAGTGIRHSEFNGSGDAIVHFLQIWLLPREQGLAPRYDQIAFDAEAFRQRWRLIASPEGEAGSVQVFQDVRVSVARLDPGNGLPVELPADRFGYLHVARGSVSLGTQELGAGDALKFDGSERFEVKADRSSELLLFDLA